MAAAEQPLKKRRLYEPPPSSPPAPPSQAEEPPPLRSQEGIRNVLRRNWKKLISLRRRLVAESFCPNSLEAAGKALIYMHNQCIRIISGGC